MTTSPTPRDKAPPPRMLDQIHRDRDYLKELRSSVRRSSVTVRTAQAAYVESRTILERLARSEQPTVETLTGLENAAPSGGAEA